MSGKRHVLYVLMIICVLAFCVGCTGYDSESGDSKVTKSSTTSTPSPTPTPTPIVNKVQVKVVFSENIILDRYDVDMYIDKKLTASFAHGKGSEFVVNLIDGDYTVRFENAKKNTVYGELPLTVKGDTEVVYKIASKSDHVEAAETYINYKVNVVQEEPSASATPEPTETATPTPEPSDTPIPTFTPTPTNTPTSSPTPEPTPMSEPTLTPEQEPGWIEFGEVTPELTGTPDRSQGSNTGDTEPTSTPSPTSTPMTKPTNTPTPKPTSTPTPKPTSTPTPKPTKTPTPKPTKTPTPKPTKTPTPKPTKTPTPKPKNYTKKLDDSTQGKTVYYVVNIKTKKFHRPGCGDVGKMNAENKEFATNAGFANAGDAREWLISQGYSPCGHCHP